MQKKNNEFESRAENFRRLTREVRRRFFYRAALESALLSFLLAALTGIAFAGVCALGELRRRVRERLRSRFSGSAASRLCFRFF